MREEFTSLAFMAVTLAGVASLDSGLLALVIVERGPTHAGDAIKESYPRGKLAS